MHRPRVSAVVAAEVADGVVAAVVAGDRVVAAVHRAVAPVEDLAAAAVAKVVTAEVVVGAAMVRAAAAPNAITKAAISSRT